MGGRESRYGEKSMAFEYSSQSRGIAFPNPLKVHNRFLIAASAILSVFALAILFSVRNHLAVRQSPSAILVLFFIAVPLLVICIRHLYTCLSHLRFFFGIGRPRGLAPEFTADGEGTTQDAEYILKQTLRQQAITYREPKGPIIGLLYSIVPNLIYAPEPLRQYAEWQFKGGLTLVTLLIGLAGTLVIGLPSQGERVSNVSEWVGVLFFLVGVSTLIRQNPSSSKPSADSGMLSVQWVSLLIAFAIVGPILISLLLTNFPIRPPFNPFPHVFFFLLVGIAFHGLFFASVVRQLLAPPPTAVSVVHGTWSFSTNPAQITAEFFRAMQESWREKIPNRRYARIEPRIDLNASAGTFTSEIIEETQPSPRQTNSEGDVQFSPSGFQNLILALAVAGLVFIFGAGLTAFFASSAILDGGTFPAIANLYAISCWSLSSYALSATRRLWLRFDFSSQLYWLDMSGQYVSAKIRQGNVIQGQGTIDNFAVQVEGMTFRLWMAEIHTVTFGKDDSRYIVSMAGNPLVAEGLASRLKDFAMGQASVFNLYNAANAERMAENNLLVHRAGQIGALASGQVAAAALGESTDEP